MQIVMEPRKGPWGIARVRFWEKRKNLEGATTERGRNQETLVLVVDILF